MPLAVSSAVRFSSQAAASTSVKWPTRPLVEFRLRTECFPTDLVGGPQPTDSSLGLLFPSAHEDLAIHAHPRSLPHSATVRPQGLVTLSTAYSRQIRAGFVSHRQRSWDSPFGAFSFRKVSACFHAEGPTCRFACRYSRHPKALGRPKQAAASGL